jgi:hypothetical protein
MDAHVVIPGLGHAVDCAVMEVSAHRPQPLRFVWHHIQPQQAGGLTVAQNLCQLCDSCHYSIHRLMWTLAQNQPLPPHVNRIQLGYARAGYNLCARAGTLPQIPNEG